MCSAVTLPGDRRCRRDMTRTGSGSCALAHSESESGRVSRTAVTPRARPLAASGGKSLQVRRGSRVQRSGSPLAPTGGPSCRWQAAPLALRPATRRGVAPSRHDAARARARRRGDASPAVTVPVARRRAMARSQACWYLIGPSGSPVARPVSTRSSRGLGVTGQYYARPA